MTKSFTLIEVVIVIVLMGIMAGMGIPLFTTITKCWTFQTRRTEMVDSGRLALERMTRDIRDIRNSTGISSAADSSLSFTDINSGSLVFDVSGGTLRRTLNGTANSLCDNVAGLAFNYYDSSGAVLVKPVATTSSIRRVEIVLDLSFDGSAFYLKTSVSPRRMQ